MPSNIFHIGYHKTGTTWLQRRLYAVVENYTYVNRKIVQQEILWDTAFKFDLQRARQALLDASFNKPMIISEEELSGSPHTCGMYGYGSKEIAHRLHQLDPEAQVVIFIRRQEDMAASIYQQYIREGGTYSAKRYLFPRNYRKDMVRHPFKFAVFNFDHLDYPGLINQYRELFGPQQVKVYLFEAFRENTRQFVKQYMDTLQLDIGNNEIDYKAANRSYHPLSLLLLRSLNMLSYRSVIDKHYLANILSNKLRSDMGSAMEKLLPAPKGEKTIIDKETQELIRSRFRDSNTTLARELALPLAQYGYAMAPE